MPIDRANVGRTFPATAPWRVTRDAIREFAETIGAMDPAYRDAAAARALGHPDVVAPPTFAIALTYAANLPLLNGLGISPDGLLHGNQRFAYRRPIRAGDELVCVVAIDSVRTVDGVDYLTTRGDVSTVDGEPVVAAWCTLVIRSTEPVRDRDGPAAAGRTPGEPP